MKFFLLFLVIVLPVSTRKLSDPVASLMNVQVQDPDVEDRRRFRFQNEEQKKTVICPKNLRCGEECLWNGKKGPVRVVPKGGCCPSEGWTGTVSCNGHGACIRDIENSVIKPGMSGFIEIEEDSRRAPKVKYNIMLTAAEMKKSLAGNYATDMAQSIVPFDKKQNCDLKLKEEFKVAKAKCKKDETYGCGCVTKKCLSSGRDEMTMWVDKGCAGIFESLTLKTDFLCSGETMMAQLTKEQIALLETTKTECSTVSGFSCEIGQGPKDKKFSDLLESVSLTRLTAQGPMLAKRTVKFQAECFQHCRETEECVSFDFARISKKKKPQPNCRLYRKNTQERVGDEFEGGRKWLYCVVEPTYRHFAARCGTDKKKCLAAKCLCAPGWAGFGCEIDLNAKTPCSPLDPACGDEPAPPPVPCFGQPEDFPLDHPCRSTFAYNVPYPPRSPPKSVDGLDESLQAKGNSNVPIWKPKEDPAKKEEGGDE